MSSPWILLVSIDETIIDIISGNPVTEAIQGLLQEADVDIRRAERALLANPSDGRRWERLIVVARRHGKQVRLNHYRTPDAIATRVRKRRNWIIHSQGALPVETYLFAMRSFPYRPLFTLLDAPTEEALRESDVEERRLHRS